MKRIIPLLLVFCFLFSGCAESWFFLSLIATDKEPSQKEITTYVLEHQQDLEALLALEIPDDYNGSWEFPEKYMEDDTIVESVIRETETVIDFSCGGTGLSTSSTYTGFYYSSDDTPYPMVFDSQTLEETAPGVYHWENEDSSHITHSQRICKNWFYYHVKWH